MGKPIYSRLFPLCLFFCLGLLFSAWRFNFFYILIPCSAKFSSSVFAHELKKIVFFVPDRYSSTMKQYQLSIIWDLHDVEKNMYAIIEKWLFLQQEAGFINKDVKLQTVALAEYQQILYISFSKKFLKKKYSLLQTLHLIQSLAKTLSLHMSSLQKIYFLVNHQPCKNVHIDFSRPLAMNLLV